MTNRRAFVAAVAISPLALGLRRAAASPDLDRDESAYIGELLVYESITSNANSRLAELIDGINAGWADLTWQNDVIGVGAVYNAVDAVARKIGPPDSLQPVHNAVLVFLSDNARFGTAIRVAVEQGSSQAMLDASAILQTATSHRKAAYALLNEWLAARS